MTKRKDHVTAVDLKLSGKDHFFDLYRFTKIYEWLTSCNIDFKLYYVNQKDDALPHTILIKESDATALKLKFNL
jgi:hypothetical protein